MALEEQNRAAEFIASEANGTLSRAVVTIASGNAVKAGAVLGKITASGKYAGYDPAAVDGTEDVAAIAYEDCDATAADATVTAIVRQAEVFTEFLVWDDTVDAGEQATAIAQLESSLGVIAR